MEDEQPTGKPQRGLVIVLGVIVVVGLVSLAYILGQQSQPVAIREASTSETNVVEEEPETSAANTDAVSPIVNAPAVT